MFTYKKDNLYSDFLSFLNPEKLLNDDSYIEISLNNEGEIVHQKVYQSSLNIYRGFLNRVDKKVEALAKVEMAFHALNSQITEQFPKLNGEKFLIILRKIKEHFGDDIIIPQCYELIRIIRNKFQHDKTNNLKWEENDLIIKQNNKNQIIISLKGLNVLVYLIWYSLKNNINYLYNKIILNSLYHKLQKELKLARYTETNKKGDIYYEFNGLVENSMPWLKFDTDTRNVVKALSPEKLENGYKLRRIKTIYSQTYLDENGSYINRDTKCYVLDYIFNIEEKQYRIPEEYFYDYKDGEDVMISYDELNKFINIASEIANF